VSRLFSTAWVPYVIGFAVTLGVGLSAMTPPVESLERTEADRAATFNASPAETIVHGYSDLEIDRAIRNGLEWLVRHQFAEGAWDSEYFSLNCHGPSCSGRGTGGYDVGVTGLALLAFVRSGALDDSADGLLYEATVRKGMSWLLSRQHTSGAFMDQGGRGMYNQAIASLAVIEVYDHFGDIEFRRAAIRAVDHIQRSRNADAAWRYGIRDGDSDTSVTGWCVAALAAAKHAGLDIDPYVLGDVAAWLDTMTDRKYYRVGYNAPGTGTSVERGVNEDFADNATLSAIGITIRHAAGRSPRTPQNMEGIAILLQDLPVSDEAHRDYYYWYHGSQAMQGHLSTSDRDRWRTALLQQLIPTQSESACQAGSWRPDGKWSHTGGRIYSTAMNLLSLAAIR
jgi:hypothetical protein